MSDPVHHVPNLKGTRVPVNLGIKCISFRIFQPKTSNKVQSAYFGCYLYVSQPEHNPKGV